MIIYRAINTINGKSYIGLTRLTLEERKHKHWLNSRNEKKNLKQAFYLAINKYGWDKFEWQELCSALTLKDLSDLEKHFIQEFDSYNNGYNNTLGGLSTEGCRKEEQYIIRFPDGTIHLVTGWNKFIREHNLNAGNLWRTLNPVKTTYEINGRFYTYYQKNHHCKGYTLLGKFNDYPDREYIQMDGSGELLRNEDEDIVCSNMKVLADNDSSDSNEITGT